MQSTLPQPDSSAVRTALWRALHVFEDAAPFILEDTIGYDLIQPEPGWKERPDMKYTRRLRASVVARARLVEDVVLEEMDRGTDQYVLLGAGLDSFAQRNRERLSEVAVFEIDQKNTLEWKAARLQEEGYTMGGNLHFVPVDFETALWWEALDKGGFNRDKKAVVSSTGVSLYLSRQAIMDALQEVAQWAPGSMLAMAFYLPLHALDPEDQPMQERAIKGAAASGTPFQSFFLPGEIQELVAPMGFASIEIISTEEKTAAYFSGRADGLWPASGEFFLLART